MDYANISVSRQSKERFLKIGPLKTDTQEVTIVKLLDFYERYHEYETEIKGILGD